MPDGASKLKKTPDLNDIVNCFADSEQAIVAAIALVGQIPKCIDDLAREANAAEMDVRAFELGEMHKRLTRVSFDLGCTSDDLMEIHKELYKMAQGLDLDIPQPRTGGR